MIEVDSELLGMAIIMTRMAMIMTRMVMCGEIMRNGDGDGFSIGSK